MSWALDMSVSKRPDGSQWAEANEVVYLEIPYLSKTLERAINTALMIQQAQQVPCCCYQIAEALAKALREIGFDENARAIACDVYGWNHDLARFVGGMPIEAPKKLTKADKAKAKRHPQRKGRFKGKVSKKDEKRRRPDLEPYYFGIFHEQVAEGNGYDGHVVVEAGGFIIDCTSIQFDRSHRGVKSDWFIIFPANQVDELHHQYAPFILRPRSTKEQEHPDHMKDLFANGSLKQNQILVSSPKQIRKNGQIAYCLRPDIEPDRWLNHTPTAKTNIEWTSRLILSVMEQIETSNGRSGTIDFAID
jgi:hypothetical protein